MVKQMIQLMTQKCKIPACTQQINSPSMDLHRGISCSDWHACGAAWPLLKAACETAVRGRPWSVTKHFLSVFACVGCCRAAVKVHNCGPEQENSGRDLSKTDFT